MNIKNIFFTIYKYSFYYYRNIVNRFWNVLNMVKIMFIKPLEEKKQVTIYSLNQQFVDNEKLKFLETYKNDSDQKKFNENIDPIFYNLKEYNKIIVQKNNELENKWNKRILYDTTPVGNIIMFYDVYKKGFSYYCDVHVTHLLLNAVAMKYVRIFFCRDLFIDDKITPVENPSPFIQLELIEEKEEKDEKKEKKEKNKIENKQLKSDSFIKVKKPENKSNKEEKIMEEQINNVNRYINMGKISNLSFIQKINKKRVLPPNKNIFHSLFEEEHGLQKEVMSYREYRTSLRDTLKKNGAEIKVPYLNLENLETTDESDSDIDLKRFELPLRNKPCRKK